MIKAHPRYDYHDLYARLCVGHPNLRLVTDIGLQEILPFVATAVLLNIPSSAAFDVLHAQIPLVSLQNALYKRSAPSSIQSREGRGYLAINEWKEFESALQRVLSDQQFRKQLIEAGRQMLKEHVALTGEKAAATFQTELAAIESRPSEKPPEASTGLLLARLDGLIWEYLEGSSSETILSELKEALKGLQDTGLTSQLLHLYLELLVSDLLSREKANVYVGQKRERVRPERLKQLLPKLGFSKREASKICHDYFAERGLELYFEGGNKSSARSLLFESFMLSPFGMLRRPGLMKTLLKTCM